MDENIITAISASVIALLALIVSIWQGIITRRHNKLSVMPVLHFFSGELPSGDSEKTSYHIQIENRGLGPALIRSFQVYYRNHLLTAPDLHITPSNLLSVAADMAIHKEGVGFTISSRILPADSILSSGDKMELLLVEFNEQNPIKRANVITNLYEIDVRTIYTSLYQNGDKHIRLVNSNIEKFPPLVNENLPEIRKRYPAAFI